MPDHDHTTQLMSDGETLRLERREHIVFSALRDIHNEGRKATTKSKYVAERTGHTPKEVAQVMPKLADRGVVEPWGESNPTTWVLFPDQSPSDYTVVTMYDSD